MLWFGPAMGALKGKSVLVTGGLGFIGSNLARRLLAEGARVTLCDALIEGYGGNLANIREIRSEVEVDASDIRDAIAMERLVEGRDVIFHLAAQVSHVMSLSNPYPDIDINIKGTAVLLEACRKRNPQALIVRSGTRGQYGPAVKLPVSEETPSDPRGIYEISQLSAEMICRTYTRIHRIRTVPLRLTNIYGPRGQMKHSQFGVVNWFARLALEGRPIPIFGSGKILRDFLYVDDCVEALLLAASEPAAVGEVLNVGHDRPSHVSRGRRNPAGDRPGHAHRVHGLHSRAAGPGARRLRLRHHQDPAAPGWEPRVALREGLARTVEFYRERRADYF